MGKTDYERFEDKVKTVSTLGDVKGFLHWDQQVMMPDKGIKARSKQNSVVSKIIHQKITSEELGNLIQNLDGEKLEKHQKANLREIKREHERAVEVPEELEEKISQKESETVEVWEKAREEEDFEKVAPHLQELVELKRQYAEEIDGNREPYQVLFEDYEPYIRFETMEQILERLKDNLTDLFRKLKESNADVAEEAFKGSFEEEKQRKISEQIVEQLGYDWDRGRLDTSAHPFTLGNQHDCRITTRFNEEDLAEGFTATVHECGHALYELGLPKDYYGTPAGKSRDLSVHESQSRLWENHVARSKEFWEYMLPKMKEQFPDQFDNVTVRDCYESINQVNEENKIRIFADEVSYHLHIVIRFEIERAMINGDIEVEELPEIWNDKMEKYLGVRPESDAEGVMQDIHWHQGSIGYFTTYSLGSVIAAQLYRSAEQEIEDLDKKISNGEFRELLEWLRENIHQKGQVYKTEKLIQKATGEKPTADYFLEYVEQKYSEIYNL